MGFDAAVSAQQTMARQAMSVAMVKQSNDMQKQVAQLIADSSDNVPASSARGQTVNITV